jgi:GNAT superfamily N-acetyltransferase
MTKSFEVRALALIEAGEADALFRLAFGTFLGLSDPMTFRPGASIFAHRLAMYPDGVFAIEQAGQLIGAAIANRWGKVGVVGPVVVTPHQWQHGVGRALVDRTVARLEEWGCDALRLVTFPHSPRHLRFYQRYDFWPASLSASMALSVSTDGKIGTSRSRVELLSYLSESEAAARLKSCADLAACAEPGLDLTSECRLMRNGDSGDVVLVMTGDDVDGFAVCAAGKGSEAGEGNCIIKAAIVGRSDESSDRTLSDLIHAASGYAFDRGLVTLFATVSTGNLDTYKAMLDLGFVVCTNQIIMNHPPLVGRSHGPKLHALLDLR